MKFQEHYSPEQLKEVADAYFAMCDKTTISLDPKTGARITKPKTVGGLCEYAGVNRDYLNDKKEYKDPKRFDDVIKYIKQITENDLMEKMLTNTANAQGAMFVLKNNYGYKDKIETENTNDNKITITFA